MSKRLEDYELKSLTDAANLAAPDGNVIKALTELQERRADDSEKPNLGWNRDMGALKEHLNTGKAVVVFGSTEQYSHVVETYVEGKGYFGRETWIYYTNPIAWLPWEG